MSHINAGPTFVVWIQYVDVEDAEQIRSESFS